MIMTIAGILGSIALLWSWCTFGPFINAANSVKQLNEHVYYMEFKGDLQLDDYLANGGAATNDELAVYIENLLRGKSINSVYKKTVPLNTGCASISVQSPDGKIIFGRNYDWGDLNTAVIVKSTPKNGYKSISTVQLDFVGFGDDFKPDTFEHKYLTCAALFVPLDGMNEKGLVVSDLMAGDNEQTNQDKGKSNVTTTLAIRAILDFCADVPEAIKFLEEHDMHSVIGRAHHFAISDRTGRMVVVEYVDNQMFVTEANVVTNHYLCKENDEKLCENSILRLNTLNDAIAKKNKLTEEDVKNALFDIRASQYDKNDKTWWRAVFNQTDLTVNYAFEENTSDSAAFNFKL